MRKKAFFRLSFAAIVLGAAVFALTAPAGATDMQLIWSTTSGLANQSTDALAEGRHIHAIRFAKDVLRSRTSAANQLIARQNLCVAYLAQGKAGDAKPYCEAALAADTHTRLATRDGRLVAATTADDSTSAETLEAAVRANVARAQGQALAENRQ